MADTTVLAWIRVTIVDVILAIWSLETRWTGTRMRTNKIFASGSILTRSRIALIDLVLTIATRVTYDKIESE